jgi:hypothetical protein
MKQPDICYLLISQTHKNGLNVILRICFFGTGLMILCMLTTDKTLTFRSCTEAEKQHGYLLNTNMSPWLLLFHLDINYVSSLTTQFSHFISDQQQLFKLYTILYTVLSQGINPFNTRIRSLGATLPDEIFTGDFAS